MPFGKAVMERNSALKSKRNKAPRFEAQMGEILTVKELATFLHCHPSTLYRLARRGQIPYFRLGSDFRFKRGAIDSWIEKRSDLKKALAR